MLGITFDNAKQWVIAAVVCLFLGAAITIFTFKPFLMLDGIIYLACGIFVLTQTSRAAATTAFCYWMLGKLLTLNTMDNGITIAVSLAITLCLLQGMRATYFIHKYPNFAPGVKERLNDVIDTDFEFVEEIPLEEVPQSKDQKASS